MNFVDRFILDENLEDFELENLDCSELFLGILLGNLEKIKINSKFCRSLASNHSVNQTVKVVFLKKIIQKLLSEFSAIDKNNNYLVKDLIGQFNEAANILVDVFNYLGELKDVIGSLYNKVFRLLLTKFSVHENLVSVPIHSYRLKDLLNLRSSFFLLSIEDLEIFQSKAFNNTQATFNILEKSCGIVEVNHLEPKDELSIITFNTFYNFLNFLLDQNIDFDYRKIVNLLIAHEANFTYRQKQRFREFYDKLINLNWTQQNSQFTKVFSFEPDYQLRKVTYESYPKRPYNSGPKPIIRRDYNTNHIPKEYKRNDPERPKTNPNREVDNSVKTQLQYLIDSLKYYASDGYVDEDYIVSSLKDLMKVSESSLIYHLADFSYYEQEYTFKSIFAWDSILRAVEKIENYPKVEFKQLSYYIEYLKDLKDKSS